MTPDTFAFLFTAALVAAIIMGQVRRCRKPKEKVFYSSQEETWYDPTYYYGNKNV